jgi:hypothetical protein
MTAKIRMRDSTPRDIPNFISTQCFPRVSDKWVSDLADVGHRVGRRLHVLVGVDGGVRPRQPPNVARLWSDGIVALAGLVVLAVLLVVVAGERGALGLVIERDIFVLFVVTVFANVSAVDTVGRLLAPETSPDPLQHVGRVRGPSWSSGSHTGRRSRVGSPIKVVCLGVSPPRHPVVD